MEMDAVLIAGPTASGKSAFATALAKRHNGLIINADSMQVYDHLRIITARPSLKDTEQVPHALYGHRDPALEYSVAKWLLEANTVFCEARQAGQLPIFVGGTGMYFSALLEGLSQIPEPDETIRKKWRDIALKTPDELMKALERKDPSAAKKFSAGDSQRIARALEVIESSGKSILHWQEEAKQSGLLAGFSTRNFLIMPPREKLHQRINARAQTMLEEGAVDEVTRFNKLNIDSSKTACKAIGISQISDFLANKNNETQTLELIRAATRQYAKRQCTWFNNQFDERWTKLEYADPDGVEFT